jgi:malonyl-CoA O-methyltransferase
MRESVEKSFSRSWRSYEKSGYIQNLVAQKLLEKLPEEREAKRVLDLGCGSGFIYKNLGWKPEKFYGVDFSENMLKLHPKSDEVELFLGDFDKIDFSQFDEVDLILSSSSLQWSRDIEKLFHKIEKLSKPTYLAIFGDKTFLQIQDYFQIPSPIYPVEKILNFANGFKYKREVFQIEFENTKEILQYIKESGVSGGGFSLSPKRVREFIRKSPFREVTFEILYLWRE